MDTVKVACVGAGYFSRFHVEAWGRIDGVVPVGACDRDVDKAKATGWPAFEGLDEMLMRTAPDLLDVILPPEAQAGAIRLALARGVKWIICQKPFCRNLGEARQIVAEAKTAGVALIVHENFRFQPWYRRIADLLSQGLLGDVHQATFRLRPGDGQGPDAYLDRQPYFQSMPRFLVRETAVHWIDTFRFLLGDPTSVYADLRRLNPAIAGEDAGHILFHHPGGVRSLFDGNRHLDHAARNPRCTMGEALVEGTEGTLSLTGDGAVHLRRFGATETREVLAPYPGPNFGGDCVHALQSHVISAIRGGTACENTGEDYLAVLKIERAVYVSAERGHRIDADDPDVGWAQPSGVAERAR